MVYTVQQKEREMISHEHLLQVVKKLPGDYQPYGQLDRWANEATGSDCSCGCLFYTKLEGDLGMDWGVCTNPKSHRVGLLTFEHQGCPQFEEEDEL